MGQFRLNKKRIQFFPSAAEKKLMAQALQFCFVF